MEKVFKVISHITIAVVIWKIYKLEQKSRFENFENMMKKYNESRYAERVESLRNIMNR